MQFDVVFGMQYGSEGKGGVIAKLAKENDYKLAIRTGAPNAGHTFWVDLPNYRVPAPILAGKEESKEWMNMGDESVDGFQWHRKVVHQLLPSGAPWIRDIFFAPNSILNLEVLEKEIIEMAEILDIDPRKFAERITIDPNVAIMSGAEEHIEHDIELRKQIGSTMEGVGEAQKQKISRTNPDYVWANYRLNVLGQYSIFHHCKTMRSYDMYASYGSDDVALIEGTQGTLLSINHAHYPYCTSRDASANGILADAGVPSRDVRNTIGVVRTYPIRVAGNSGPLPHETTWYELGLPDEITTVTKLVRRVARFSVDDFAKSLLINKPNQIAITFVDYPDTKEVVESIEKLAQPFGFSVIMEAHGPTPAHVNSKFVMYPEAE
jgi:adenylosuccinate synthase